MDINKLSDDHPYRKGFRAGLRSFNPSLPMAENPYSLFDAENYEFWRTGFIKGCQR